MAEKTKENKAPKTSKKSTSKSNSKNQKESEKSKLRKERVNLLRNDMINQLESQGKFSQYYKDLVDDYIFYFELKEKMKRNIDKFGLNVTVMNGNGLPIKKVNDNVKEIRETSKMMLKILSDLGIQIVSDLEPPDDTDLF